MKQWTGVSWLSIVEHSELDINASARCMGGSTAGSTRVHVLWIWIQIFILSLASPSLSHTHF